MSSRQSSVRYDAGRGGVLLELSERRFQVRETGNACAGGTQILLVIMEESGKRVKRTWMSGLGEGQGWNANVWGIAWEKCMEGKNCTGATDVLTSDSCCTGSHTRRQRQKDRKVPSFRRHRPLTTVTTTSARIRQLTPIHQGIVPELRHLRGTDRDAHTPARNKLA